MLEEASVDCPYCGEPIALELDLSAGSATYVEDCSVCCRPMLVRLRVADDGAFEVSVESEDA